MNIALINWKSFDEISGSRIYMVNSALSLKEKGNNVYILTSGKILPEYENLGLNFYTIDNDNFSEAGFLHFTRFCFKMVEKLKIDIVHAHYNHAFIAADLIKKKKNIPYFCTFHGYEYELIIKENIKTLCKEALNNANNIFYSSKEIINNFKEKADIILDERYIYMPNAVMPVPANQNDHCMAKKIILFVGRLAEEKGLYFLFEAIKAFRERRDIELHIVGGGPLADWCKHFIRQNDIGDIIKMIGEVSSKEVIKRMQDSYMVVLPSVYESMPIVLLEAMAVGKPILATDIYGISNAVENMKEGLLVENNNADELISGISRLLDNQELCENLGNNAKRRAEKEFLWDTVADKIINYYKSSLHHEANSKKQLKYYGE